MVTLVAAVVAILRNGDKPRAQARQLTIAIQDEVAAALVLLAQRRGVFSDEGLEVGLRRAPSEAAALAMVGSGEVDMAVAGGVPMAYEALRGRAFALLATVSSSDLAHRLVARRDRGIERPADLVGKAIGLEALSGAHLLTYLVLVQQRIQFGEVKLVFMEPHELLPALEAGRIDALASRSSIVSEAEAVLGSRVISFEAPYRFRQYHGLVASRAALEPDDQLAERVLRALLAAERQVRRDRRSAMLELTKALGPERHREVVSEWPLRRFEVALGRGVLISLESHARWLPLVYPELRNRTADFLGLLHPQALRRVRPARVTIW